MKKQFAGGFKRIGALMMSIFIILSQFAFPAGVFALELTNLPTISLSWLTGETTQSAVVSPSLYAETAVYWATLPAEALQSGVTVEVLGAGEENVTYAPAAGTLITPMGDASAVDGFPAVMVEVYRDGMLEAAYPLYLSTLPLPEEPKPEPVPAFITVKLVDSENGQEFYSLTNEYTEGSYTFEPDASYLPENYVLDNSSPVTVNVYADGTADLHEIVFTATYVKPEPIPASITVKLVDSENGQEFYSLTNEYTEGSYTFEPDASYLPESYVLDSTSPVTVNVYADGTADLHEIVFTATYVQPEPIPVLITVTLMDGESGQEFYSDSSEYTEGSYTFDPDVSYLPENYVLDDDTPITVNVYADGTADAYEVIFTATYVEPEQPDLPQEPVKATLTVSYVNSQNWNEVFYTESAEYAAGDYTFEPDASHLPENYVLDSTAAVTVSVYEDGTASQTEVFFTATYVEPEMPDQPEPEQPDAPEPQPVDVVVSYLISGTDNVLTTESYSLLPDVHTIAPNALLVESMGYVLDASAQALSVTVYEDGTCSPSPIVFVVNAVQQPEPEQPEQPDEPEEPEQPEEPEIPDQPQDSTLPEGSTLISELNCQGETTKGKLRFRSTPTTDSSKNIVFEGVNKGVVVQVTSLLKNASGEEWYGIVHNGTACYVRGDCLKLLEDQPAVINASVSFRYVDENGADVMEPRRETFTEAGAYSAADYAYPAPEGFEFSGVSADSFTVDENGATPAEIFFYYKAAQPAEPVKASITIYYECAGESIADARTETVLPGPVDTSWYRIDIPGYTYAGVSAEQVVVDENGIATPSEVRFYYDAQPVVFPVLLRHMSEDGQELASANTELLDKGAHDPARFQMSIEGYTFLHADATEIVVDESGANPSEVTLTYRRNEIKADVAFSFADENGQPIPGLDGYIHQLGEGTHETAALAPAAPDGYTFQEAQPYQIVVDKDGANPNQVTFIYKKNPVKADVTFHVVDESNNVLSSFTQNLGEGTHSTSDFIPELTGGYLYNGASAEQVTVNQDGASPAEVYFYFIQLPAEASLPIYIHRADQEEPELVDTKIFTRDDFGKTFELSDFQPETAPEGYVYGGANAEEIIISARGEVSPAQLVFTYTVRPKAEAEVTFEYLCDGKAIKDAQTVTLPEGVNDVFEYRAVIDGYNFLSSSAETVTVHADGTASVSTVTFTYEKIETEATLTVHYRNSFGEDLPGSPEVRKLTPGKHTITPNASFVPADYTLSSNTVSHEVEVSEDLVATPASVSFSYYEQSLKGEVTVNYFDTQTGTTFATETISLSPGNYTLEPNEQLVASKGNYVQSDYLTNSRVTVDERGTAEPSAIVFYYKPAEYQGYQGYLLTTQQTALRSSTSQAGDVVLSLAEGTVLLTTGQHQAGADEWYSSQTCTGESGLGWVIGAHVRRISADEAKALIEEANQPKEPEQNPGYYTTIMNNVPLRKYMTTAAQATYLNVDTVVYAYGQHFDDEGLLWHEVIYKDYDNAKKYEGFIRDGQLRKLTQAEAAEYEDYLEDMENAGSKDPYDPNGPSTYGYVTKDSVNFRATPNGSRMRMLNKYGMALIIGSKEVDGVTWYNVNYSGQIGWIHGDYFHQMTLTEFTSFMGSQAYYQGITNNTVNNNTQSNTGTSKPSTNTSSGSATQGNVSSVEDWNVGAWQNTGVTTQTSYQPFNPYATPAPTMKPKGEYTVEADGVKFYQMASTQSNSVTLPKDAEITIAGTVSMNGETWYQVSYDGRNGYVQATAALEKLSATPTPEPTSTFVIGTMIPITYDDESKETQTGTVPWGLIGGAIALVGGAGGVYAYALNQNKKRKAAAARAAASKRAAAAGATAAGAASPYARRAVAAAPANGQQRPAQQPQAQQRPSTPYSAPAQNPYSRPNGTTPAANTYARPVNAQPAQQPVQPQPMAQQENPYARPKTQPAPIVNPYASGTVSESKPAPGSNPYARPIGSITPPKPMGDAPAAGEDAPVRRRATRMQRYHAAEEGEDK